MHRRSFMTRVFAAIASLPVLNRFGLAKPETNQTWTLPVVWRVGDLVDAPIYVEKATLTWPGAPLCDLVTVKEGAPRTLGGLLLRGVWLQAPSPGQPHWRLSAFAMAPKPIYDAFLRDYGDDAATVLSRDMPLVLADVNSLSTQYFSRGLLTSMTSIVETSNLVCVERLTMLLAADTQPADRSL